MVMVGCFYYYEGYIVKQIIFLVWVMVVMGVQCLVIFNVVGSVNVSIEVGDIVFICDYINLYFENLLWGENDECLGLCFFDMFNVYDCSLNVKGFVVAKNLGICVYEGVYFSLQGFNLEILVEYKFVYVVGVDMVGMFIVFEVLVAWYVNFFVLVFFVVINKCYLIEEFMEIIVEEVIVVVQGVEFKMWEILLGLMLDLLLEGQAIFMIIVIFDLIVIFLFGFGILFCFVVGVQLLL